MVRLPSPAAASEMAPEKVLLPPVLKLRLVLAVLPRTTLPPPESPLMEGPAAMKLSVPGR